MSTGGFGRRELLAKLLGGAAAAALLARCRPAPAAAPACTLYPEQTEGPFYVDRELVRRDITDGRPGTALALELLVVAAPSCPPLPGVAVDVWHCDAAGLYSGHARQLGGRETRRETFLRGTQVTGADGRVRFETIYPGWYPGRTTHVHFKVHLGARSEATSQLYFPDDVTAAVYRAAPYAARGQKDTPNAADGIADTGGAMPPLLVVRPDGGAGLVASATIGVAA